MTGSLNQDNHARRRMCSVGPHGAITQGVGMVGVGLQLL